MAIRSEIRPDERGLALRIAMGAMRSANSASTARAGSVYIPNGDGTGTIIGEMAGTDGTGGANGVAPWVGDTTPPGRPTGISCSSAWGTLYVSWDGTLEGGVPADFAYVSVLVDGQEVERLTGAGTAVREDLENGSTVQVSAVAYDAARDSLGNPAPNASEPWGPVSVRISDERAEIDADVEAIRQQAQQASDRADEAWDKAEQQAQQVEQAVQAAKDAADKAEEASTGADSALAAAQQAQKDAQDAAGKANQVASDLSSTAADLSGKITDVTKTVTDQGTKIEGAVEDAGNALKQATELSQTVDGVKATAESALTTAQGTQETVTSLSATVEGVKADVTQATDTATDALSKATSVEATANGIKADLSTNYLSKTDASTTYATNASLSATSESLTASIESAATSADAAMQKATEVEATAGSISTKLSQVSTKLDSTAATASAAQTAAGKAQSAADAAQKDADAANSAVASTNTKVNTLTQTVDGMKQDISDVTETASDALSKATSVEATANGIKADLSTNYLSKTDASKTYATQASLSATSSSLTTKITEAATAAGNAMDKATEVEQTASGIRADLTETAKTADSALTKATSVEATANGLKTTITAVKEDVDTAQSTADSAKTAASNAQSAADKAQTAADSASTNASTAISRVTSLSATVDGISTKVEQTATTASDALTKATSAQQSIDGFKTTVSQTYLTKTDASSTYATKASLSSYATKTELSQTSDSITASVEEKFDDSLLIKTEEGGIVQTGENAGMPLEGLTVYGNTRQNLWVNPRGTGDGITFTSNDDGSVTISGTSTSDSVWIGYAQRYVMKPGSTYTLSVDNTLPSRTSFRVEPRNADGYVISGFILEVTGSNKTVTAALPSNTAYVNFLFCSFASVGTTVSGTYRVMLNEGSSAEPWCSPGLNSVGDDGSVDIVTTGKNLLNIRDNLTPTTTNGITFTPNPDGTVTVDGESTTRNNDYFLVGLSYGSRGVKNYLPKEQLVFSSNGRAKLYGFSSSGETTIGIVTNNSNAVITAEKLSKTSKFVCYLSYGSGQGETNKRVFAQLELGSTATAYEPPAVTTTPVPLDSHALNSLPDGTRDELTIDAAGAVKLVQRVGVATYDGSPDEAWEYVNNRIGLPNGAAGTVYIGESENGLCDTLPVRLVSSTPAIMTYTGGYVDIRNDAKITDVESGRSWLASNPTTLLYPLATPKVIPLASIEMPELPEDGATIWLSCADNGVDANGEFSWYGRNAKALDAYATRAQLKIESDSIKSEVSQTYTTKKEASEIEDTANKANSAANAAQDDLDAYKDTVSTTYATKSSVDQTASEIKSEVATTYLSKTNASSTYATKTEMKQSDDSIKSTVSSVKTTADSALKKATTVEQTADGLEVKIDSAVTTANTAKSTADSAKSTANTANTNANTAKTNASTALSTANTAKSTADSAKSTATTANNTANSANSTANAAKTAAANAAKTATNYLKFDSAGLCVGNHTGTLGYNTLVKAAGIDIRNGSTVLASFEASLVELGRNSASAQVKMCGGKALVGYGSSGGAYASYFRGPGGAVLAANTSGDVRDQGYCGVTDMTATLGWRDYRLTINSSGNMLATDGSSSGIAGSASLSNFGNLLDSLPMPKIRIGSKVVTVTSGDNSARVWTPSEFQSAFGRAFNAETDFVGAMNADGAANDLHVEGFTYLPNQGLYVVCDQAVGTNTSLRVNYLVALAQ